MFLKGWSETVVDGIKKWGAISLKPRTFGLSLEGNLLSDKGTKRARLGIIAT